MPQTFSSHTLPDPIIHNIDFAMDNLVADLRVTIGTLSPVFGLLETIADGKYPSLSQGNASDAITLLIASSDRLKAVSQLADAIQDAMGDKAGPRKPRDGDPAEVFEKFEAFLQRSPIKQHTDNLRFYAACDEVEKAIAAENESGLTEDEVDRRTDFTAVVAEPLYGMTPPNVQQLIRKAKALRPLIGHQHLPDYWGTMMVDLEALATKA